MRDHFISSLTEIAQKNNNIILITGDLGFGVLDNFIEKYPKQFINSGVAEQNMTGIASGLGMDGKTVFTYSIGNFNTLRCLEQIRNDACYHNSNVNIVSVGGGFSYGALGYSHHATEDIAIMRAIPNLRVFSPCDFWEIQEITKQVVELGGVNYIRIDKSSAGNTRKNDEDFIVGKGRVLTDGTDVTIIATGGIVELALEAQKKLNSSGISCKVVSMHTIKPIDKNLIIDCVKNTGALITLEEHSLIGGLGSAVSEILMQESVYPKRFKMMGLESSFSTIVGSQSYLRKYNNLDTSSIIKCVKKLLS
jgi:transketolase|tara:strand:+ start:2322 stop:3242 length:921 start_codon:yes stop_codon:yes gene_type:complete